MKTPPAWGTPERPIRLAICMPIGEHIDPIARRAFDHLEKPKAEKAGFVGSTVVGDVVGMPVDLARRELTQGALQDAGLTHILWIDSDMTPPVDAVRRLIAHDLPIVGALCHNRRPPYQPILARRFGPAWGLPRFAHGWCYHYPLGLFEVDLTGAGFLLVKPEVFRAIERAQPGGVWWDRITEWPEGSEDFCFMVRAQEAGYRVLVDTTVDVGHRGLVTIDRKFASINARRQWNAWFPTSPTKARGDVSDATPVASIIIPTYNQRPVWLRASVVSALAQTVPCEVIVVDDGTTDYIMRTESSPVAGTAKTVGDVPVLMLPASVKLVCHPENRGVAAALNTGIEAMTTEWFCWLPSDDLFDPRKVEVQLAAMSQANTMASYHAYVAVDEDGTVRARNTYYGWPSIAEQMWHLCKTCAINGTTVMINRSVFADVGQFDSEFRYGHDWEMWCRIGQRYLWHGIEEVLATRREYENLTSVVAADADKKAVRDLEDERIRCRYEPSSCPRCGRSVTSHQDDAA